MQAVCGSHAPSRDPSVKPARAGTWLAQCRGCLPCPGRGTAAPLHIQRTGFAVIVSRHTVPVGALCWRQSKQPLYNYLNSDFTPPAQVASRATGWRHRASGGVMLAPEQTATL